MSLTWTPAADGDPTFTPAGTISSDRVTVGGETLTDVLDDLGPGGGADHTVDLFTGDFDAGGGAFSEVPLFEVPLFGATTVPRTVVVGATVAVTIGDSTGLWTITASGPCTPGAALTLGDVIASGTGRIGVAASPDGTPTVAGIAVAAVTDQIDILDGRVDALDDQIDALDGRVDALDGQIDALEAGDAALELVAAEASDRLRTGPTFALCSPAWGGSHHGAAWLMDPPGDFTTGAWCRVDDLVVMPYADWQSGQNEIVYSEIATQTHDADTVVPPAEPGYWDNVKIAVERRWDADASCWRSYLFADWTEIGDSIESHSYSTHSDGYEMPLGVPVTIACHLEFDVSGQWRLRFWRRVWHETPDATFDGADWRLVATITGNDGPTNIDTGVTDPWGFGFGLGRLHARRITVRDAGATGTLLALLDAQDAADADDGTFTDQAGNEVEPGPDASTTTPGAGGGVDSVNGQTGVVTLDSADVGADPAGTGDAILAIAIQRSEHTGTQAQSTIDGLTTDLAAKAPTTRTISAGTGLTGGGDLSADRTLAIDAATLARIGVTVDTTADVGPRTSTTATADGALEFAAAADTTYRIDAYLIFQGDTGGDLKVGFTAPAGTMHLTVEGALTTVASNQDYDRFLTLAASNTTTVVGIAGASTPIAVRITGVIHTTAAGTVALIWAPNAAGAGTGVTRLARSQIYYRTA